VTWISQYFPWLFFLPLPNSSTSFRKLPPGTYFAPMFTAATKLDFVSAASKIDMR